MKITTLNERIEKAKATIEKKNNTISKKLNLINKKLTHLESCGYDLTNMKNVLENMDNEEYKKYGALEKALRESLDRSKMEREDSWEAFEIQSLADDIRRNKMEIVEKMETLKKYEAQLNGELEKESIFLKELPECIKAMKDELVERWDSYDMEKRDRLQKAHRELGYSAFMKKYHMVGYNFIYLTDEQIHDSNESDAKALVMNLYARVKEITGEITSWDDIHATMGAYGTVLNGKVIGKEGIAYVESILAGGYNIQRLHVRVLVKERI